MERRKFTAEFKREAVKLASQVGLSKAKMAELPPELPQPMSTKVRRAIPAAFNRVSVMPSSSFCDRSRNAFACSA